MSFRIGLIGSPQVGKSTFMMQHISGHAVAFSQKQFTLIWHTNRGVITFYVTELGEQWTPNSLSYDGYILMFDLQNRESYDYICRIAKKIPGPKIVCGNKSDLSSRDSTGLGIFYINIHNEVNDATYVTISGKTRYKYDEPFLQLCRRLIGPVRVMKVQVPGMT